MTATEWREQRADSKPINDDFRRSVQLDRSFGQSDLVVRIFDRTRGRLRSAARPVLQPRWVGQKPLERDDADQEHVIERFSRPSKNYITYQVHVEDPIVLVKSFTSAPLTWTLAQDPNDVWTEYICTENEDPETYKNINQKDKDQYEKDGKTQQGAPTFGP